jgi:hypothetical protein
LFDACNARPEKKSKQYDDVKISLQHISALQDVWDIITWFGSGKSVVSLSQVSKTLRLATKQTPAFILLAGRDSDGFLVPWQDPSNVLNTTASYAGWNPSLHFRIRASNSAHALNREISAITSAESFMSEHPDCILTGYPAHRSLNIYPRPAAPSRPSTACANHENDDFTVIVRLDNQIMTPVVFPPGDLLERSKHIKKMYASPYLSTSSSDDSDSSSSSW